MSFTLIDEKTWQRKAHFHHYLADVPCTYSATFKLDVTALREQNVPFFPTVLHCLSTVVNRHKEFRMSLNAEGLPGYYDILHPCFTVFHEDTETFSNLWTEYCEDRHTFYSTYKKIWNDIKIVTIWWHAPTHRKILSPFPHFHGRASRGSILTFKKAIPTCFPFLRWGNFIAKTEKRCFLLLYRSIMPSVTAFTYAALSMSCKIYSTFKQKRKAFAS